MSTLMQVVTTVATGDAVNQLKTIGDEIITNMQTLGLTAAAIAFAIGGFQHIFGGAEGLRKAKPWYIGAVIGFLAILGCNAFAGFINTKLNF